MDTLVLDECTQGALNGVTTFPETLMRIGPIGVERYHADLVRMEKTYYFKDGRTYVVRLPVSGMPSLAREFDAAAVAKTVKTIQRGEIDYQGFLRRVVAAGCTAYAVFLDGRHAAYYGRKGEVYVEKFPDAKA